MTKAIEDHTRTHKHEAKFRLARQINIWRFPNLEDLIFHFKKGSVSFKCALLTQILKKAYSVPMQPYQWDFGADHLWLLHRGQLLEEADEQSRLPATHTVLPVERTGGRRLLEGGRGGVFSQPSPRELLQHPSSLLVHHLSCCAGCRTCQRWVVVLGSFPKLCGISAKLRISGKTILQDKIMHFFFLH